jgi:AraC-like DNA-binding protein
VSLKRILYESDLLAFGDFNCPPDAPLWRELNTIDRGPCAVFPATSVVIRHLGRRAVLANPNHVIFYNRGQSYERRLHDPSGDRCLFVRLHPRLLVGVTGGRDGLPFACGPSSARAYLAQHLVISHLRAGKRDPLFIEEALTLAVGRVVADSVTFHQIRGRSQRTATSATHHELVESAKLLLSAHLTERLPLRFFARALFTSEFHLARVFRSATGFSLHQYRNQLRLRCALERIAAQDVPLSSLAHELGFASHSHFTDSFRQVFGVPPSLAARWLTTGELRDARAIVDAR